MGKKCCVSRCNGNFDEANKASVFRLPKDAIENERWRTAIPRDNIPNSPNTVVCERHWPANYEYIVCRGKRRPIHPPTIFQDLPPSMVPTAPPKPRKTTKACSSNRSVLPDQKNKFMEADTIKTFCELKTKLIDNKHDFRRFSILSFFINNCIIIQSTEFEQPSCIPRFLLKVFEDFTYVAYHCGIRCTISSLSSNRITHFKSWSIVEEAVSFLNAMEKTQKKHVLLEQISSMSSIIHVGDRRYDSEAVIRAFEYFTTSRTLYNRLREDYELPSVPTLT